MIATVLLRHCTDQPHAHNNTESFMNPLKQTRQDIFFRDPDGNVIEIYAEI
jgi:catechol 2,3-dioxygenase-like lactoylglutathione lyase family enzyme